MKFNDNRIFSSDCQLTIASRPGVIWRATVIKYFEKDVDSTRYIYSLRIVGIPLEKSKFKIGADLSVNFVEKTKSADFFNFEGSASCFKILDEDKSYSSIEFLRNSDGLIYAIKIVSSASDPESSSQNLAEIDPQNN